MRENTTNLGLVKPDKTDQYNVADFNDNMQKIDDFAGLVPARALTADKLTIARNINGVAFDGTKNVITGIGLHSMTETYSSTNVVYKFDESNQLSLFRSKQDGNKGHATSETDWWEDITVKEKDFLNTSQITNCILEAPNGVAEWSGVTPTGTLVNNQGVVSGFSESNYLTINKTPPAETMKITSFELYGTSSVSAVETHSMVYGQLNKNYTTPQLGWSQGGNPSVSVSDDGSTWVTAQITSADGFVAEANQTYNMLATWDSTSKALTFKIKKDTDATYTFSKTTTVDSVNWTGLMAIGMDQISTGEYFRGTIDLSQSYIKINGEMWWQGNDLGFNQFRVKEGLKTLIPNGRNEDRTLRNIENNVSEDLIYTFEDINTGSYWAAVGDNAARLFKTSWEYNNDENYIIGTLEDDNYGNLGTKILVTMIGDAEVKNGNIVSFTPYQPVQLAKEQDIDGMWTTANYTIFENVSFTAQEVKTYDLSAYLPNDGNIYEVIFEGKVITDSNVGDTAYLTISTSLIINCTVVATQTTASRTTLAIAGATLPVGADRKVAVKNSSAADTATFVLNINAYRKVR